MKKLLLYALIGCMSLSIAACGKKETTEPADSASVEDTQQTVSEDSDSVESSDTAEGDFSYADMDGFTFDFCSGAGAWATTLELKKDGSFTGDYHDSDMGDTGENYPNGTVYVCSFSGTFGPLEKVDDYTYKTTIKELTLAKEEGVEEYADDVRYVYANAYGMDNAKDIYFYLNGSKISDLPEGFVEWLVGKIPVDDSDAVLPFIGIYNENAKQGFCGNDMLTEVDNTSAESGEVSTEDYYKAYETCVEKSDEIEYSLQHDDMSQTEINLKSKDLYDLWDAHLNYLWGILKASLSEDEMSKLTTEEKQWITEKEAAMDAAAAEYEGGSIYPLIYNQEGVELTKKRVEELQKYLK